MSNGAPTTQPAVAQEAEKPGKLTRAYRKVTFKNSREKWKADRARLELLATGATFSDISAVKDLSKTLREGLESASPEKKIAVMQAVYDHLTKGKVKIRRGEDTTTTLNEILLKIYARYKDVQTSIPSDSPLGKYIRYLLGPQPEQALQRKFMRRDLSVLEADEIINIARILADRSQKANPASAAEAIVANVSESFGVQVQRLPAVQRGALYLELHSKGLVNDEAIKNLSNSSLSGLLDNLSNLRSASAVSDAEKALLDGISKSLREKGAFSTPEEAISRVFSDEKFVSKLQTEIEAGITRRGGGDDAMKAAREQFKEILDALSSATDKQSMDAALQKPAPPELKPYLDYLGRIRQTPAFTGQLEVVGVLEKVVVQIGEREAAEMAARGRLAPRAMAPAGELAGRAWDSGAKKVKGVLRVAGSERMAEARAIPIPAAKARQAGKGVTRAVLVGAAIGAGIHGIRVYSAKGKIKDMNVLASRWKVRGFTEAAFDLLTKEPLAKEWLETRLRVRAPPSKAKAYPTTEPEFRTTLRLGGLYVNYSIYENPRELEALVKAVVQFVRQERQKGTKDQQIDKMLGEMMSDPQWRARGFFLTRGELLVELLGKQLYFDRVVIDFLKTPQGKNFLLLMWAGIQDGSIPRAFSADLTRQIFSNRSNLEKLATIVEERSKIEGESKPSVAESLIKAGIKSDYLLLQPIAKGSIMDIYDQFTTFNPDKYKTSFEGMLKWYKENEGVRSILNSFQLKTNEIVYGDVAWLADAIANATDSGNIKTARSEYRVADRLFAALGVTGRDDKETELIRFVHSTSENVGDGAKETGLIKWLRKSAKNIKDAKAILEYLHSRRSDFEDKKKEEIEKIAENYIKKFSKNGWYRLGVSLKFEGFTPREIVPRGVEVKVAPLVVIQVPAIEKFWNSETAKPLRDVILGIAKEAAMRTMLAANRAKSARVVKALEGMKLSGAEDAARKAVVTAFKIPNDRARRKSVMALADNAQLNVLRRSIEADIASQLPAILRSFFAENATGSVMVKGKKVDKAASFAAKYGVKVEFAPDGAVSSIEMKVAGDALKKNLAAYFQNKYGKLPGVRAARPARKPAGAETIDLE